MCKVPVTQIDTSTRCVPTRNAARTTAASEVLSATSVNVVNREVLVHINRYTVIGSYIGNLVPIVTKLNMNDIAKQLVIIGSVLVKACDGRGLITSGGSSDALPTGFL